MVVERRVITSQDGASHVVNLVYDDQKGEMVQVIEGPAIRQIPSIQNPYLERKESNDQ